MKNTRPRFALLRSGTLAAVAGLSILVACEARLPTSAEVEAMDVASMERAATQAKLLDRKEGTEPVYKVNGKVVTGAEAHAVASDRIATVNIAKGMGGKSEVYIVTNDTLLATHDTSTVRVALQAPGVSGAEVDESKGVIADKREAIDRALKVVRTRIEGMSVSETVIQKAGNDRIIETVRPLSRPTPFMSKTAFTGIVLIDGVRSSVVQISAIPPSDIASVEVFKGAAAAKLYSDPLAVNGVIKVTTTHAKQ